MIFILWIYNSFVSLNSSYIEGHLSQSECEWCGWGRAFRTRVDRQEDVWFIKVGMVLALRRVYWIRLQYQEIISATATYYSLVKLWTTLDIPKKFWCLIWCCPLHRFNFKFQFFFYLSLNQFSTFSLFIQTNLIIGALLVLFALKWNTCLGKAST